MNQPISMNHPIDRQKGVGRLLRNRFVGLILIVLLALGVRLLAINARALWYDEAFAVLFSEKGLESMLRGTLTLVDGAAADVHPLLYYQLLNGCMTLFGQAAVTVRLFSVLLGVLTVIMLYGLSCDLFDQRVGVSVALVAALAPFHVQYSQEVRMYALLGLLLVTATWAYLRAEKSASLWMWLAFAVLAALSMYTQQLAAFYLLALALIPLIRRRWDLLWRMAASGVLALLLYAPWLVSLPTQLGKLSRYWVERPTALSPLQTLWAFLFVELEVRSSIALIFSMTALILIIMFLAVRLWATWRRKHKDPAERDSLAFAVWLVLVPMALLWIFSQWRPVYVIRGLLPSAMMLYVLVGWLFATRRLPTVIRGLIIVVWLGAVALGLNSLYTWNTFPRPPFSEAVKIIAADLKAGDRVLHANKITMLPMVYYDRLAGSKLPQAYLRDTPGSGEDTLGYPTQVTLGLFAEPCAAQAVQGSTRVWFVIFKKQLAEEGGRTPALVWLDAHYRRLTEIPVSDLLLIQYDQPDAQAQLGSCDP